MNLDNMVEGEDLLKLKDKINKVFFFRICGTGMGASACLLKEAGIEVEGADQSFSPPMSTYLDSTGIPCYSLDKVDKDFLQKYDLIIVGNSVPRTSEHAKLIEECGVPFTSFPSVLGTFVLKDKEVIGLAGTHGKTTTTYFLTQMLESLGEKPGYFIGGIMNNRPPSKIGESKFFAIESDEYDSAYFQKYSKFRLYELNSMVLTSLEFDHADIYDTVEDIEKEFEAVIPNLTMPIIANDDYNSIHKLKEKYNKNIWKIYGENSELGPRNIKLTDHGSSFNLIINGKEEEFITDIIGLHNILNISSCLLVLEGYGFKTEKLKLAVLNLGLVKRRQEVRGEYRGSIVIDDFAHHPRAIRLTIDAIKMKYQNKKIITVFEPVSATARSSIFQKEFAESLLKSDQVIIAQSTIQTTAKNQNDLDCDQLVSDIKLAGIDSSCSKDLVQLREEIDKRVQDDSVLLVLSNRTCIGLWESEFVNELK
jgi:UDP-N-acetylmuramate: L-alanyl-gamma-D-glutamyl-meso-diaminopimelate ligase